MLNYKLLTHPRYSYSVNKFSQNRTETKIYESGTEATWSACFCPVMILDVLLNNKSDLTAADIDFAITGIGASLDSGLYHHGK